MSTLPQQAPSAMRRHWRGLALLGAAALALHAALLSGASWWWPSAEPPPLLGPVVALRLVEAPAAAPAAAPIPPEPTPPVPEPAPARGQVHAPARPVQRTAAPRPAARPLAPPQQAATSPVPAELQAVVPANEAPPSTAPPIADMAAPPTDDAAARVPTYRTRFPSAATLRYEVRRGPLRGTGELRWEPAGDRYALQIEFALDGLTILTQRSTGGFDAAGLAPERFTDRRARRGTVAANFRREVGELTYSGSANRFTLVPGAQDRLGAWLQLAAIVAADPALAQPEAKVVMFVTGARGDAGVWVFRCLGTQTLATREGPLPAIAFLREPREPYDLRVQVWLDPARQMLPVEATQQAGGNDEAIELRLLEVRAPN